MFLPADLIPACASSSPAFLMMYSAYKIPSPGDFPNSGIPHCRQILYQLSHQGSPRILEWVAYPFSRGSFWPRNLTGVSCIAGRIFYQLREALTWHSSCCCCFVAKSSPTLCDPMDCSSPGSSVHGTLQTRTLEWVAIPFSRGFSIQGLKPALLHCRQILYHWAARKAFSP